MSSSMGSWCVRFWAATRNSPPLNLRCYNFRRLGSCFALFNNYTCEFTTWQVYIGQDKLDSMWKLYFSIQKDEPEAPYSIASLASTNHVYTCHFLEAFDNCCSSWKFWNTPTLQDVYTDDQYQKQQAPEMFTAIPLITVFEGTIATATVLSIQSQLSHL